MEQASTLEVIDAIVVSWMPGAHRPRVTWSWLQEVGRREPSLLVALLRTAFAAVSTHASIPPDLADRCAAAGLDPTFLEAVTARLAPRSSSLLVLSGAADLSVVIPAVRQRIVSGQVALMQAELPADGPERLRAVLGLETPGPG
jgi:hypothetical protein